tara:strand:+ start:159 stop:659 length:501 start_codon:yes stop_codon:yes gene_type:complete
MGTLTVQTLQAPTSGANANTILVPSGQTVHAAGSVVQVVNGSLTTGVTNATTTYADTGVTATITPKFATSKILVNVNIMGVENAVISSGVFLKLLRGSTDLSEWAKYVGYAGPYYSNHPNTSYLDSPSTTSATVYKVQMKRGGGSGNAYINANSCTSTITLMEIAQ